MDLQRFCVCGNTLIFRFLISCGKCLLTAGYQNRLCIFYPYFKTCPLLWERTGKEALVLKCPPYIGVLTCARWVRWRPLSMVYCNTKSKWRRIRFKITLCSRKCRSLGKEVIERIRYVWFWTNICFLNWEQNLIASLRCFFAILIKKQSGFVQEYLASQ